MNSKAILAVVIIAGLSLAGCKSDNADFVPGTAGTSPATAGGTGPVTAPSAKPGGGAKGMPPPMLPPGATGAAPGQGTKAGGH